MPLNSRMLSRLPPWASLSYRCIHSMSFYSNCKIYWVL
jgi:hypothetical protein